MFMFRAGGGVDNGWVCLSLRGRYTASSGRSDLLDLLSRGK